MKDVMATQHNDVSVLENHHLAASFAIISREKSCNWTVNMSDTEYKRCRHLMIENVLNTDMTKHFVEKDKIKTLIERKDFNLEEAKNKEILMKFMFHLADISNPWKPFNLCRLWTDLLFAEFFDQGDLEKKNNLAVSQFMDRTTTNIAKGQIGFIDFVIKPSWLPLN